MPNNYDNKKNNQLDWKLGVAIIALLFGVMTFFYGSGQCNQENHPFWIVPFLEIFCPESIPVSTYANTISPQPFPKSSNTSNIPEQIIQKGNLLFEDNFKDNQNGWLLWQEVWLEGGFLHGFPKGNSAETWPVTQVNFQDFIYETVVTYLSDKNLSSGKMGPTLYFRGTPINQKTRTSNQFYTFGIHGDNGYQSQKADRTSSPETFMNLVWKNVSSINPDKKTYKIDVIVKGNNFQLWVDDVFIDVILDYSLSSGTIGLGFGADTHVAFDYVKVWSLP